MKTPEFPLFPMLPCEDVHPGITGGLRCLQVSSPPGPERQTAGYGEGCCYRRDRLSSSRGLFQTQGCQLPRCCDNQRQGLYCDWKHISCTSQKPRVSLFEDNKHMNQLKVVLLLSTFKINLIISGAQECPKCLALHFVSDSSQEAQSLSRRLEGRLPLFKVASGY